MTIEVQRGITIEHVAADLLHPDPANPRRISAAELEALTRSIRAFGLVDPVIARREDSLVVGGHQRLLAARKPGMKEVPVVYVDLSLEKARLLNVALNKISGSFDDELLARMLADLKPVTDLNLTLSGFSEDELDKLLKTLDVRERREKVEDFDLDAALEQATRELRTKRRDIWLLGEHRLLCSDSSESEVVDRLLDGKRAAMAFTDPPYDVDYGDGGGAPRKGPKRVIANDHLDPAQWTRFVSAWASSLRGAVDGDVYVCMSTREWPTVDTILRDAGFHWSGTIVWMKDHFVLGRSQYHSQYEPIWYGWPKQSKSSFEGGRRQANVWEINRPLSSEAHPTMKPLALMERAIANSSKPGNIVLDPFLGSGSTLIAVKGPVVSATGWNWTRSTATSRSPAGSSSPGRKPRRGGRTMPDGPLVLVRDPSRSVIPVRRSGTGECLGCIEIGLFEILRDLLLAGERDSAQPSISRAYRWLSGGPA